MKQARIRLGRRVGSRKKQGRIFLGARRKEKNGHVGKKAGVVVADDLYFYPAVEGQPTC